MGQGVFEKTTDFLGQVKSELKKVTWPSKKETFASTRVVILLVLFVALFLWLVDYGLSFAVRIFLR